MKAAIYVRVSSREQTVENQLPVLYKYAESRQLEVATVYQEQESAWMQGHQKELSRLMKDAEVGNFQVVVVWALDRLTREGAAAILTLINKFKNWGVKVWSYQESWTEIPGEFNDLLFAFVGWAAQMESKRKSERVKAAIRRRKETGGFVGRKPGSKDKRRRKNEGYLLREARKRVERLEAMK